LNCAAKVESLYKQQAQLSTKEGGKIDNCPFQREKLISESKSYILDFSKNARV
jgi:hypothetical protein